MPRKPRQFEIGNIYHVINRGVDGRKIFTKNQDYSRFILSLEFFNTKKEINIWDLVKGGSDPTLIEKLKKEREKPYEPIVELLAFVLMPNHYHLLIREITHGGISLFMQKIGGYSLYFNEQYDRSGSLFQSRYKCVEIKTDAQLFAAFNYVHTNPVELIEPMWKKQQVKYFNKANDFLKNYENSSYRDYIGIPTFPNTTSREFFLEIFNREKGCRKEIEDWIKFKANNYTQKGQFNQKDFE